LARLKGPEDDLGGVRTDFPGDLVDPPLPTFLAGGSDEITYSWYGRPVNVEHVE
jgi:hypothetical protein